MTFLSVCFPAKNEMAMLPDCVAMWAPVVDEICVLDTGSTDGTLDYRHPKVRIERSKRFNADTAPEDFDYGAARNEALDMARGEWTANVDPDCRLTPDEVQRVAVGLATTTEQDVVVMQLQTGDERVCQPFFFRTARGYRYINPVHESLQMRGASALYVPHIIVQHIRAYDDNPEQWRHRAKRYIAILCKALLAKPDDANLLALLAQEYYNINAIGQCGVVCESVVKGKGMATLHPAVQVQVRLLYANALSCINKPDQAREQAQAVLDTEPRNAAAMCALGVLSMRAQDAAAAEQWFQKAMQEQEPSGPYMRDFKYYRTTFPAARLEELRQIRRVA